MPPKESKEFPISAKIKKIWLIIAVGIALSSALGFVFPNPHPHFWWQKIPVFDVLFGLLGCAIIILFSKWIGQLWLSKSENHYD